MSRHEAELIVNNMYFLAREVGLSRVYFDPGDPEGALRKAEMARQALVDLLVSMERKP